MADHPAQELLDQVRHDWTNHPPDDEDVVRRLEACRDAALECFEVFVRECPTGRDLSLARTSMEQSLMYARAAIARNQGRLPAGS